jgi:hypothetical protein
LAVTASLTFLLNIAEIERLWYDVKMAKNARSIHVWQKMTMFFKKSFFAPVGSSMKQRWTM